jgi:DNA-binding HxlR family transcriptional regulator
MNTELIPLIERTDGDAYTLTETGSALGEALRPLDDWARSWAGRGADRRAPKGERVGSRHVQQVEHVRPRAPGR